MAFSITVNINLLFLDLKSYFLEFDDSLASERRQLHPVRILEGVCDGVAVKEKLVVKI